MAKNKARKEPPSREHQRNALTLAAALIYASESSGSVEDAARIAVDLSVEVEALIGFGQLDKTI